MSKAKKKVQHYDNNNNLTTVLAPSNCIVTIFWDNWFKYILVHYTTGQLNRVTDQ